METEGSLSHSQQPATRSYPEPDRSSSCPHPTSLRSVLLLFSHLCLDLSSGLLLICFPTKTLHAFLLSTKSAICPTHFSLLDLITRIIIGEEYRAWSSLLCSLLHSAVTSSLLGPNILLSTLFSKTLSLRSSLNASDQVSHPYKTTGKILALYITVIKFLDSKKGLSRSFISGQFYKSVDNIKIWLKSVKV